jgi:hypothetical protein
MKKIFTAVLLASAFSYANAQKVQVLDRCESLDAKPFEWYSGGTTTKLDADHKEGGNSISSNGYKPERLRKIYEKPFDTGVSKDNGYIAFWFFVEKPELLNGNGQVAISSSASSNKDSYGYAFGGLKIGGTKLVAGWNSVVIPLSSFNKEANENPNLSAINYFRIVLYNIKDDVTTQEVKIDHIRFSEDKAKLETAAK